MTIRKVLQKFSLITLLFSFHTGPSIFKVGPIDLKVFDALFVITVVLSAIFILTGRRYLHVNNILQVQALLYPIISVIASIIGVIIFVHPSSYLVGDMRWMQSFCLAYIIFSLYNPKTILYELRPYIYFGILLNLFFLSLQLDASFSTDVSKILEWWHKDIPSTHSYTLGFSYGRFGGATGHPSRLGIFSAVSITYIIIYPGKKTGVILALISIAMLIASGSRTSIGATLVVFVVYAIVSNRSITTLSVYALLLLVVIFPILYKYNIGRVTSERYQKVVKIITGEKSYHEVSGRGSKWSEAIDRRNSNFMFFGTLANPSYVYADLTIDSGLIHIYTRLGPVGLLVFIFSLLAPFFSRMYYINKDVYLFCLSSFIIIAVMSVNANSVTGTNIKNLYMFSLFLIR